MITVTVDYIDGSNITNDIRCIDPAMIVPGSIRPSTVNTTGSACIMEVLTWDGNIQNYRAVRWVLTDTFTTIVASLNLVAVTLAKVNGESVTADLRGLDPSMIVPGTMRPLTANNTATAAVLSVLTWDNNTFTKKAVEWQLSGTYAATKTAIELAERTANQFAPPYAAATGTDTYALTLVPAITAYTTGVPFYFQVANTNTGASTLNVNGLGAKALVKGASTALAASDLTVGKIYQGVYDGTRIQVTELAASTASEWTTATVAISSAEILTIGSVGKTLLAAPGAGTYYEIESVRLEYDHNTTAYTIVGDALFLGYYSGNYPGILINTQLISTAFDGAFVWRGDVVQNVQAIGGTDYTTANAQRMNEALVLQMFNATDPTLGNGTMRALIRYKIRTFGA
jgi:hypothetical protein